MMTVNQDRERRDEGASLDSLWLSRKKEEGESSSGEERGGAKRCSDPVKEE